MTRNVRAPMCLLAGIVFANTCFGQEVQVKRAETPAPQPRFYRLEFVLKELENDKVVNSRLYTTSVSVNTPGPVSIRAGSRIPLVTTMAPAKQYNYYDVGVNIDIREVR